MSDAGVPLAKILHEHTCVSCQKPILCTAQYPHTRVFCSKCDPKEEK